MASSQPAPSTAPSLVDTLFQLSLDDLVKSLRADQSAAGESSAVARALSAIHREIRAPDAATKATALQKLTYLSSLHFAPVAAHPLAFPAIELLASPHLPHKRLAYLAASLSLSPASLSLLPLATHQLHKDLSPSTAAPAAHHLCALALHLLASPAAAAAPDLAAHLAQDLVPHLSRGKVPAAGRPASGAEPHRHWPQAAPTPPRPRQLRSGSRRAPGLASLLITSR
jgi:AP-3 complex subunit delta-1